MQEILSQNEIDSLLEALTSGQLDVEEVKHTTTMSTPSKPYDFRRPNKFSKEHLRSLEMLHQNFARLLSSFFSGYLRASINIEIASVGQMIFEEFMRSIPSPTVLTLFECKPLVGAAIMETNSQVVFPLIDLMFGGPGSATDKTRELTDIEITVVRRLYERVLDNLASAWHDFYEIDPVIEAIETNPRMQQLYSQNEVVALITFSVSIEEEPRGLMNLCIPYIVLEPVISKLSVRQQFIRQTGGPSEDDIMWIKHWLGFSNLNIDVILGETEITVRDFLQLQVDDILTLSRSTDQDLDMYVENELKFGVQAGRVNKNLAVQVVALIEGDKGNG